MREFRLHEPISAPREMRLGGMDIVARNKYLLEVCRSRALKIDADGNIIPEY